MTAHQKIELAKTFKKGDSIKVEHIDGLIVYEIVSEVKVDKNSTPKDVINSKGKIIETFNEISYDVLIICESCAVYEPNEIAL
jgi:hypothetical protein